MSITQQLQAILQARYGRDVRQAIHDSIEEGYNIAVQAEGKATTAQDSASASASAAAQSSASALQSAQLAEQYKNEAFSGTPAGYEALVEKVNSIRKETASQYAIVGSSEGSALAHTIYGMSVQDGTPTPSVPVDIVSAKANFKCVGRNLNSYPYFQASPAISNGITFTVNNDGTITAVGIATADAYYSIHVRTNENNQLLLPLGHYKLSGSHPSTTNKISIRLGCTRNGEGVVLAETYGDDVAFDITEGDDYFDNKIRVNLLIVIKQGYVANNIVFKPTITLADADDTSFEPYHEYTADTDLVLRAIEVTSSDDYNLVRDGKYYIADTVDWSEDRGYTVTRRIKEITINSGDVTVTSNPRYGTVLRTAFNPNEFSVRQAVRNNLLLSAFVSSTYENFVSESGNGLAFFDGTNLRLRHDSMASTANWSTYLQNNPVKVIGVLITPTTEPITSEQAQALLSLKTYDEASYISSTGSVEPSVDLEYAKSEMGAKALTGHNLGFKNALKLNDINTALIELGGN